MWQGVACFFFLGAKSSKDNFTFNPEYSGILILLSSKHLILLCEVNTINDQARKNITWLPLEKSNATRQIFHWTTKVFSS